MKKKIIETYKGMNQDMAPSKFPKGFYYEAYNIRIAPANNTNTQYEVTNLNASKEQYTFSLPYYNSGNIVFNLDSVQTSSRITSTQAAYLNSSGLINVTDPDNISVNGLVGILETHDFVIFILKLSSGADAIYKATSSSIELLYVDNLGTAFGTKYADIKYFYENENLQKIYIAVKGQNILMLNIADGETYGLKGNHQIVPDVEFGQISGERYSDGGYHTSGMIQYAYSAYYKNGASSTISPLSEPIYLVDDSGRGKAVNQYISQINAVTVPQIDNFEYVKIYSIKYNELTDIPIISVIEDTANPGSEFTIYDDNTIIESIASEEFLFLGGSIIKPSTIEIKNNRLFAGNIDEDSFDINVGLDVDDTNWFDTRAYRFSDSGATSQIFDTSLHYMTLDNTFTESVGNVDFSIGDDVPKTYDCYNSAFDVYNYTSDLSTVEVGAEGLNIRITYEQVSTGDEDTLRLKQGEIYRWGLRFTNSKGQRSPIHWVVDLKTPYIDSINVEDYYKVNVEFKTGAEENLYDNHGVRGIEVVRVIRTEGDKSIVCQGFANGMMFQTRAIDSAVDGNYSSTAAAPNPPYNGNSFSTAYEYRETSSDDFNLVPSILPRTIGTVAAKRSLGPISAQFCSVQKLKHLQCLSLASPEVAYGSNTNDSIYSSGLAGLGTDTYLDDFGGMNNSGSGTGRFTEYSADQYEEISSGSLHNDETNMENRTYQYTKMWQIFSPEIEFSNIQLAGVDKVAIVGGQQVSAFSGTSGDYTVIYGGAKAKEYYIDKGTIKIYSPGANNGYLFDITSGFHGTPGTGYGLISAQVSNQSDQYQYLLSSELTYTGEKFQLYDIQEYDIYGTPEYAAIGTKDKVYNNDQKFIYSTILENVTSDDLTVDFVYSQTNKSVVAVPVRGSLFSSTDNSDKINHLPLEEAIYDATSGTPSNAKPALPIVELRRTSINQYGGNTYEDRSRNKYIPVGDYTPIDGTGSTTITILNPGDTYLQLYNCVHNTWYDNTMHVEDTIMQSSWVQLWLETSINLQTRYDLSADYGSLFINSFDNTSLYNTVYSRKPDIFYSTPTRYDETVSTSLNNVVRASKIKSPGETIDSFTDFLVNEEISLDGKYGSITRLYSYMDEIYAFQENGISHLSINPRVIVSGNDGVQTELGTGQVLDRYKYVSTQYGLAVNDFNAIAASKKRLYFYDRDRKSLCYFGNGGVASLDIDKGMHSYVKNLSSLSLYNYTMTYDSDNFNLLFNQVKPTKTGSQSNDLLVYNELTEAFTHIENDVYKLWPSALGNTLYSLYYDTNSLTSECSIYKAYEDSNLFLPLSITYLSVPTDGYIPVRFDNIQWDSYVTNPSTGLEDITKTFTSLLTTTDYQSSGNAFSSMPTLYQPKRKFRIWRIPFYRSSYGGDRFRAPHAYIRLAFAETGYGFNFGDVIISYNI